MGREAEVGEDLPGERTRLDDLNDPARTATGGADQDLEREDAAEQRGQSIQPLACFPRRLWQCDGRAEDDEAAQWMVGSKDAVRARQVEARQRDEPGETLEERERAQDEVRGPVTARRLAPAQQLPLVAAPDGGQVCRCAIACLSLPGCSCRDTNAGLRKKDGWRCTEVRSTTTKEAEDEPTDPH